MNTQTKSKWILFLKRLPVRIILILQSIIVGYPIYWTVQMSLKSNREILTNPWDPPKRLAFENYVHAFIKSKMGDYFFNSILITILSLILLFVLAVPAAYVLSRFNSKILKVVQIGYMSCIFIQGTYIMVPLFLEMMHFGMLNNRFWISLIYAITSFPFTIFLLSGFIHAVPHEYDEAAAIDGCTRFQTMVKIILPMCKSGLVTVAMLSSITFWNEYPLALVMLNEDSKRTLPIGLANLFAVQQYATDWGGLFAAMVLILIPTAIIYLVGYKRITSGLSVGGIKG